MAAGHYQQKLSFTEKAGYGFGEATANFVYQTMLFFQLGFDTDVFGITAAAAGKLGSVDANRGDLLLGWDADQFPTDMYSATQP